MSRTSGVVPTMRGRLAAMISIVAALNIGAWLWALIAFRDHPSLLGVAIVVYGLGLRHAVDADHIAAIDNVTRKLIGTGQRPVAVGFFFAVGHSAIVAGLAALISAAAVSLIDFQQIRLIGGLVSQIVSAAFLVIIAIVNLATFMGLVRQYRAMHILGTAPDAGSPPPLLRGPLTRLLRPLFRLVSRSWQMALLGFLFGLGFDTASEVSMFTISATQAAKGISSGMTMALPLLFAAGMTLVDTADGVLMLSAFERASASPRRRLIYNMSVTFVSAAIAVGIGGIEALALVRSQFALSGPVWRTLDQVQAHFNAIGIAMVIALVVLWVGLGRLSPLLPDWLVRLAVVPRVRLAASASGDR